MDLKNNENDRQQRAGNDENKKSSDKNTKSFNTRLEKIERRVYLHVIVRTINWLIEYKYRDTVTATVTANV